jgi:predicted nucleotidyltransferase
MGTITPGVSRAPGGQPIRSGLADALFSRTQQQVIGLLFGHPERSYYLSEIIAAAAIGRSGVQREVARLVASGLLDLRSIGNQKHYRANSRSPLFGELAAIVRKTVGLADPVRASLAPLDDHIVLAALFGSVAKGADTSSSDVDLLVVSNSISLADLIHALGPAEQAIVRRINPTLYNTAEFRRRRAQNTPFLTKLLASEPVFLTGSLDAFTESPPTRSDSATQG